MVPVGSSLEWSQFRANAPVSVSIVDSGCTLSSQCESGYYCHTDGDCYDLPVCAKANAGTGYILQESYEDVWEDCSQLLCYTGYCSGIGYHCGLEINGEPCGSGMVCDNGICVVGDPV